METATAPVQTLNLVKDQKVDLTKVNPTLLAVCIGLGWDTGFDLDSFAFLLKDGKRLTTDPKGCVCYFGNLTLPGVKHSGDNLTGAGDGDDETITVTFADLPADCTEVIIGVNIFNAGTRNFGAVKNAFARIYDKADVTKASIVKYDLSEDYSSNNAVIFGKLYKHNGEWKFQALGSGMSGDINQMLAAYS